MGLSKLLRAALTVNPLARTATTKKLATTRTQLEKILQEGSEATAAQRKKAREKLDQMNKVEAGENVQRQAKQSKAAPEGASKKKKLAPPSLKSLEGLPDNFSIGGMATKNYVNPVKIVDNRKRK